MDHQRPLTGVNCLLVFLFAVRHSHGSHRCRNETLDHVGRHGGCSSREQSLACPCSHMHDFILFCLSARKVHHPEGKGNRWKVAAGRSSERARDDKGRVARLYLGRQRVSSLLCYFGCSYRQARPPLAPPRGASRRTHTLTCGPHTRAQMATVF